MLSIVRLDPESGMDPTYEEPRAMETKIQPNQPSDQSCCSPAALSALALYLWPLLQDKPLLIATNQPI